MIFRKFSQFYTVGLSSQPYYEIFEKSKSIIIYYRAKGIDFHSELEIMKTFRCSPRIEIPCGATLCLPGRNSANKSNVCQTSVYREIEIPVYVRRRWSSWTVVPMERTR